MTRLLSLRSRVLFGALFWTIGLVIFGSAALITAIEGHRTVRTMIAVHDLFRQPLVLLIALASMVAGVVQVRRGLAPIDSLRQRLVNVHEGRERRVEGSYPSEVQPLVNDLNGLLDHRDQAVRQAIAKAGDLAHGLKTPLAVIAREAERVGAAGDSELAAAIFQQVERMRRQIDYHLAHARAAASGGSNAGRSSIRRSIDGLARTLLRLHADRQLSIDVRVPSTHAARVQREDLDEMLGNLLDNACKWARTQVVVESVETELGVVLTVDDDGPGLPAAMREAVLARGVRADEKGSGSGLGLAIVRDLAELYQGSISLHASPLGGLRATLTLDGSSARPHGAR
jgi:signal transduction histidine kinase